MSTLFKWCRHWRRRSWWEAEGRDEAARELDYEICKMQIQLRERLSR